MLGNIFAPLGMKILGGSTAILLAGCAFCYWQWDRTDTKLDQARVELEAANATIDALKLDMAILQQAAIERANDAETSRTEREELHDATNNPNDSAADRRLRMLCVLRRQQTGSVDGLPAPCQRFVGAR